ncbi:uncharacterized protein LOC121377289 [Gigantopelta aegis]|uniref:uncharacterized protein LOC121377289 n=1 Tax=Gigantopelta aegis TaxID=1735272 RepID=UPI001B88C2CB|nr:uncharacterized protein LOC121377289 [Gigantopelta aegis]
MHGCSGISLLGQIAISVTIVALCVHLVALSSPAWVVGHTLAGREVKDGILYSCGYDRSAGNCATTNMEGAPGFFQAAFGFAVIGLITAVVTCICVMIYFCVAAIDPESSLGTFNIFGSFFSGASILLAVIIFGSLKTEYFSSQLYELSWGFGIEVAAGLFFLLSGALLFIDYRAQ